MRTKPVTLNDTRSIKLITINCLILVLLLEVFSRAYFSLKHRKDPFFSAETQEYLDYVHHARASDSDSYKRHTKALRPTRQTNNNKMIASQLSECKKAENCKVILLQGDSWAHNLELHASDILFENMTNGGHKIISAGTSSFSMSNYAAQLNYLINQKNIVPNTILVLTDQTDLGDELCRYQPYTKTDREQGRPYIRVKMEEPFKSFGYNYEARLALINANWATPRIGILARHLSYTFSKSIYARWIRAKFGNVIKSRTSRSLGIYKIFYESACFENDLNILDPLKTRNTAANTLYIKTIRNYIKTAKISGVKRVIFFTHPHLKHLEEGDREYEVNIKDLVETALAGLKETESIEVEHVYLTPNFSQALSKEDYFDMSDLYSHPLPAGYREIAAEIHKHLEK